MVTFGSLASRARPYAIALFATLILGWFLYSVTGGLSVVEGSLFSRHFRLEAPRALFFSLLIPSAVAISWSSLAAIGHVHRLVLAVSRSLLLLLLTLVLAQPSLRGSVARSSTLMLVDTSPSMPELALTEAYRLAETYAKEKPDHDTFLRAAFDRHVRQVQGPFLRTPAPGTLEAASDYGLALRMAQGLLPAEGNRRIILFGDGNDTHGGLLPAAQRLTEQGIELCVFPSRFPIGADASVRRIEIPSHVELSRPFVLRGELYATRPLDVTVRLELNGNPNPGEHERKLHLDPGSHSVSFETVTRLEGLNRYRLSLDVQGADTFPENNQATLSVNVVGRAKLLVIDDQPTAISGFSRALEAQQVKVEVRSTADVPTTREPLEEFDAVLLSNVPVRLLDGPLRVVLDEFVRQGGTLIVSGGPQGYGAGGWSGSPLEALLPVYASVQDEREHPDLALVLAIDRSGSMTGLPLELAKSACSATVETLRPSDYIEVLAFDARPIRYVRMQPARLRGNIIHDLSKMSAGGDTELFYALDMAYQDLVAVESRRKHVILLTDGQSPTTGLSEIVHAMVTDNITLTTVGLGTGVDADLLKHLAERGGGRYHAAPTPDSLPRIFVRETEAVSPPTETASSYTVHVRNQAAFLRGIPIGHAPELAGYHRVTEKPSPAEVILESDRREPILARVPRGNGQVVAWTSDLYSRWASAWLAWPHVGQLFSQLIRAARREDDRHDVPMQVMLEHGHLRVEFDAIKEDGSFDDERSILLKIDGPNQPSSATLNVERVAPGRYRAEYDLPMLGDYRLNAEHGVFDSEGRAQKLGESHERISWSYPAEYETLEPNLARLEQVMSLTHSKECDLSRLAHTPPRPTVRYASKREPLLLVAVLLFLIDLALKRFRFKRPSAN